MSWVEYNDMFERAQEKGEYHLFVFDLKGSKSIRYFIPHINLLLYGIYFRIKDLEKRFDEKILHQNPIFNKGDRGDLMEPFFISGDLFGFTIIRGSLCEEDIYKIFNEVKSELDLNYEFILSCLEEEYTHLKSFCPEKAKMIGGVSLHLILTRVYLYCHQQSSQSKKKCQRIKGL